MATLQSQQGRPSGNRASMGPNILSRMLQLEKQSKQRRSHATGSGSPDEQMALSITAPTTLTAEASPAIPSSPPTRLAPPTSLMPKSQTMPALEVNMKTPEKEKPALTIDPTAVLEKDGDASTIRSEICLSPSWSDHGEKERKKAKRLREKEKKKRDEERKEAEKKARKEEEKQKAAAAKVSKREGRLNKRPPPAAMETQRMPSELRRNSFVSFSSGPSSRENSRPSSQERRRLSGISIGSSKSQYRSRSTPPTSTEIGGAAAGDWQPVVSAAPPQLPVLHGIGWHSRNGSSSGSKSNSWGSDASYTKELAQFSMVTNRPSRRSPGSSPQQTPFNENPHESLARAPARPLYRSQTDNDILRVSRDSLVVKEIAKVLANRTGSDERASSSQHEGGRHDQVSPASSQASERQRTSQSKDNAAESLTWGSRSAARVSESKPPINPLQLHPVQHQSLDGSSYVHRQRMYQQQRSLAGFQEEEAVRDANRVMHEDTILLGDEEAQEQSKSDTLYDQQRSKIIYNEETPLSQDSSVDDEQPNQFRAFLKESQDVESAKKSPQQSTSKMDRILGFGRRPKPGKHPSAVTNKSGHSGKSDTAVSLQSPSLEIPRKEPVAAHLSDTERMYGEPPRESTSPQTPKARSKLSQAVVDKEVSPKAKERSPVQVRSRTSQAAAVVRTSPPRERIIAKAQEQSQSSQPLIGQSRELEHSPLVRNHSRTRTSSSQLLNDNISILKPVHRSTTAPVLPTINLQPFQGTTDGFAATEPSTVVNSPTSSGSVQSSVVHDRSTKPKGPRSPTELKNTPRNLPEVIVESVNSEGIIRKTSIKRPRSNPQLQSLSPTPPMPSLDFLPQLKHQPLTKPKPRTSLVNPHNMDGSASSSNQFPVPAVVQANAIPPSNPAPNLAPGRSWGHRPASHHALGGSSVTALTRLDPRRELGNRMSTVGPFSYAGAEKELDKPMAKIFVICCNCRFWHDLPSKIYEAMATPKTLQREKGQLLNRQEGRKSGKIGVEEATLDTMVQCPWCNHPMSTTCCAGWTAVVYLHERHH